MPKRQWIEPTPALAATLLLAACGPGDNDPGPGGVTVGEARALDKAAEMLDAQRPPETPTETVPEDLREEAGG